MLEAGGWRLESGGWRLEAGGWRLLAGISLLQDKFLSRKEFLISEVAKANEVEEEEVVGNKDLN